MNNDRWVYSLDSNSHRTANYESNDIGIYLTDIILMILQSYKLNDDICKYIFQNCEMLKCVPQEEILIDKIL
jgi:hypothetical protein